MAGVAGILANGTLAVLAYIVAFTYFFSGDPAFIADGVRQQVQIFDVTWLAFTDRMVVNIGFLLDPICAMMLVVITTISFMVHLYSWGYMEHEPGFQRYYAFLALFTFSMLGLVVATNIFQMYIFWELVGVSSYLLIGFFYKLPSAVSASKKAFIVTRFADLFMLIGILVLSYYVSNTPADGPLGGASAFNFLMLNSQPTNVLASTLGATFMGGSVLTWAMILIFVGGMGKSAMMPLHIWLPDAMEGPTPVSALIHAATMVVAGVYLVARFFPLFCIVPDSLTFITVVGAITAFYAAVVACAQIDIKRILAFSTISQIAFMMVALGCAYNEPVEGVHYSGLGYMASMFHSHTPCSRHFSSSVQVVLYTPCTRTITRKWVVCANICLYATGHSSSDVLPSPAYGLSPDSSPRTRCLRPCSAVTMVAGLTAFYMFRMYYLVFWWEENPKYKQSGHKPHDAPWQMSLPLIILALVSCVAGFIHFGEFVTFNGEPYHIHIEASVAATSLTVAVLAIGLATLMYAKKNPLPSKVKNFWPALWTAANRRFYWDEIYQFITHKIIFNIICRGIAWFDRHIIDGNMDLHIVNCNCRKIF